MNIGCHTWDGTCYVSLSGNPFGATENCSSSAINEFRFDGSSVLGKRTYASLFSAFLSSKSVSVQIAGCYSGTWPTIAYFNIQK